MRLNAATTATRAGRQPVSRPRAASFVPPEQRITSAFPVHQCFSRGRGRHPTRVHPQPWNPALSSRLATLSQQLQPRIRESCRATMCSGLLTPQSPFTCNVWRGTGGAGNKLAFEAGRGDDTVDAALQVEWLLLALVVVVCTLCCISVSSACYFPVPALLSRAGSKAHASH